MNDVSSISGDDGGVGWYENDLQWDISGSSSGKRKMTGWIFTQDFVKFLLF